MSQGATEHPAYLTLRCQKGSHYFDSRTIPLNEVVKVGRAVVRLKPTSSNAIFDCKVLSRSHALVWYKDGRFWLRDTNSSNGTFVNNTRLLPTTADACTDREIFSGDIIRFGVDVVENETTHGCIVALVTLTHPNGVEAKPPNVTDKELSLRSEQLFRLTHLVDEALHREDGLQSKLDSVTNLLQKTREMSEAGWHSMLNEERLLQRLDMYESQLSLLKQDFPEDSLQSHLQQTLEDKFSLEKASKMMLEQVLNEKTEALCKATDLEGCLANSERECSRLREVCESTHAAYESIANDFQSKVSELEQLEEQLKTVEAQKSDLEDRLTQHVNESEQLREHLRTMLTERLKSSNSPHQSQSDLVNNKSFKADSPHGCLNGLFDDSAVPANSSQLGDLINVADQLKSSLSDRVDEAREEVALAELNDLDRFCDLQDRLITSEANLEQVVDTTSDDLSAHLTESMRLFTQSTRSVRRLQDHLDMLFHSLNSVSFAGLSSESPPACHDTERPSSRDQESLLFGLTKTKLLAKRVADSQERTEASLNSLCAQHGIRLKTSNSVLSVDADEQLQQESQPSSSSNTTNETVEQVPAATAAAIDSCHSFPSSGEVELQKLQEELNQSLHDQEQYRQLTEELKQQDNAKTDLLLSVREECDMLHVRIADIESTVTASRADHQRLAAEAKRARSIADELREEKEALLKQVAATKKEMEELRARLEVNARSSSAGGMPELTIVPESEYAMGHDPTRAQGDSASFPSDINRPVSSNPFSLYVHGPMVTIVAVVPIMAIVCALMAYIFSQFAR